MAPGHADEPTRSIEVESTYDVSPTTPVPDWQELPGVASVDAPEVRELDAWYFDTEDMALARAKVAVRRRTGGPDEGWHVKASAATGRHEWGWPLGVTSNGEIPSEVDVPRGVLDAVAEWAAGPFAPLARIQNTRTAFALRDAEGNRIAEMVDDRVTGTALRTGKTTTWREWEMELCEMPPGDPSAFFSAVEDLVRRAGGHPATSDSKLGRVLGG